MSVAAFVDADGKATGQVQLPDDIFDVDPNVPVMHAVVRAHLAAARAGTHSTKTRAEVRGGGKKPWRQKGTGRARHGSSREPQWVGGGVAHGPKPRDYTFQLTKKTRALALRCALSDRAREGSLIVVDAPVFSEPKTKKGAELLKSWGASGKVLLVTGRLTGDGDARSDTWKSFRNLPQVLMVRVPTTYTVLAADVVVLTREALAQITKADIAVDAAPAAAEAEPVSAEQAKAETEVAAEAQEIADDAADEEAMDEAVVVAEAQEIADEASDGEADGDEEEAE
ncbi:MAG TPA: 50S ribosomal protein L4 [Actinomycetota bacterium]|nr:50S ribosomal protein L4 [Actinomycetota bacterium]